MKNTTTYPSTKKFTDKTILPVILSSNDFKYTLLVVENFYSQDKFMVIYLSCKTYPDLVGTKSYRFESVLKADYHIHDHDVILSN